MKPASDMHARWLVREAAKKHVAETAWNESSLAWITRAYRTRADLSAALQLEVNGADLNQLITDFEELESLECGTHPDLVVNNAGTVDNTQELTDRINAQINQTITELLAAAEPMSREKVSA